MKAKRKQSSSFEDEIKSSSENHDINSESDVIETSNIISGRPKRQSAIRAQKFLKVDQEDSEEESSEPKKKRGNAKRFKRG